MALGFGLATSLLAIFSALACLSTYRLLEDGRRVTHTIEVLATLDGMLSKLFDAESDQRGYLITGDPAFLRPFESAEIEANDRLVRLALLTSDNSSHRARLVRLRPMLIERLVLLRRGIDLRRAQGIEAIRALVVGGRGRFLTDSIRRLAAEMVAEERQILDERVNRSYLSAQVATITYALLMILVLILIWAVDRLVRQDLRARAETELALRQSRERFELAVAGSRDGIWDWLFLNNETYYSPRWKGMLGYEDDEVSADPDEFTSRIHPEDRERHRAVLKDYLETRQSAEYQVELRLRHKDGFYRWILSRGVALRDESGRPYRMAGSHTDITARKEAESLLLDQNRRLEAAVKSEQVASKALKLAQSQLVQSEKLAGLGQMVAGVAHEINNPLAFVINNAAVCSRDLDDLCRLVTLYAEADPILKRQDAHLFERINSFREAADVDFVLHNLKKLLGRSDDGLRRIQRVVNDLRLFARLDERDLKDADLNAGIESTVTIVRGSARRGDVDLQLDLEPLPLVACQPARINQVVMNLLSNAIDATSRGGKVFVRSRNDGASVRIEVSDTGEGIDPSVVDRIFDPFFTTKPVGQGTGLGLSISYGIVRDHEGTIDVNSRPGVGTTFVVRLPLVASILISPRTVGIGHLRDL